MLAFNLLPGIEPIMGFEVSGTVVEIGTEVAKRRPHLAIGTHVIAGCPAVTTPTGINAASRDTAVAGTALLAPSDCNPGYASHVVTADFTVVSTALCRCRHVLC